MNAQKDFLNVIEAATTDELVERIETALEEGGKIVSVREAEYYLYLTLFNGCFEYYVVDLDTKKYTVTYLSITDIKAMADFIK